MKPVISIGAQSFAFLRENGCFLVDKTGLIREWWENQDAVTLITRPRRFGKTLNMNMLDCFFSNRYANRGDLFWGLSIWEEEKYRKLQGSRPVISFSFASIKGQDYAAAREGIVQTLIELYTRYEFLMEGDFLSEKEKAFFKSVNAEMTDTVAAFSVNRLSIYLERYYGKRVLILLDEYDTPMQEAYGNGFWKEMVAFVRSLFNATFKTNPAMERGLLTGITRVSKESVFSDLNHLTVVTTTSEMYRAQFGFTQKEVFDALTLFGMDGEKENVKLWYDGFTFGSQKGMYNPWSITSFLKEKQYRPYWANSSANSLVDSLIRQGNPQTKTIVEDLIDGKTLTAQLDEEIVFDQLTKKPGAIWSMLLAGGYLRVEEKDFSQETGVYTYTLRLTNREVLLTFRDMIKGWFSEEDVPYRDFLQAFLQEDVYYMNEYMNEVAGRTFSFFDVANKPSEKADPERFYHGFVLGLIVELAGQYHILSNRESGFGRYDVMLEPTDRRQKAYVLEFKIKSKREATLEDTLKAALAQIEQKCYDAELIARGIAREQIRHYGFAFEGKRVLIG